MFEDSQNPWTLLGKWGLTLLAVLLIFILSLFPFQAGNFGDVRPAFMLMALYYWTILRPHAFPMGVVFAVGLVLDLLLDWPFGMSAFSLVLAQWMTRGQRKFLVHQPFLVIWVGFCLLALLIGVLQWGFFSLFAFEWMPVKEPLLSAALSAVLFPLVSLPLFLIHRALEDDSSLVL